jgi:hypothetical protein
MLLRTSLSRAYLYGDILAVEYLGATFEGAGEERSLRHGRCSGHRSFCHHRNMFESSVTLVVMTYLFSHFMRWIAEATTSLPPLVISTVADERLRSSSKPVMT